MSNKIIAFERGAEFYFDLGYKYIQRGNLKTALRYIEKSVQLKPYDSFIQFNYAGLLAELGELDRSTEVLVKIVKELDPDYLECYFGLGCNYLQMQKIKKSAEYFSKYLEKDPDGEFAEEAEDLLEMLTMIKDANNNLDDEELEKIYKVEEEAISHLEKREYDKAAEKFETVVQMLPNAIPARNNLSLAYYYLGYLDKAIELAREVLTYEENNIHANCNLAIFYNKQGVVSWVEKQIRIIKKVNTEKAPAAIGPYSQAIIYDNILFTSGQIPINPKTGEINGDDIETQAQQVMENISAVLEEAGSSFEKVIKTTCFLKDMDDFAKFNEVYAKYFTGKPARSCVAVQRLPKDVLCEVEVIALIK